MFFCWLMLTATAAFANPDFDRGNTLLSAGDPVAAEAAFRQVLTEHPSHSDALAQLGLSLHEQGRSKEALKVLRELASGPNTNPAGRWYLGVVLHSMGDLREAVVAFQAFREMADPGIPQWSAVHWYLANLYRRLLITDGISQAEIDDLLVCIDVYVKAQPQAEDVAELRAEAVYVKKNRPPENVLNWRVVGAAQDAGEAALVVAMRDGEEKKKKPPRGYHWVDCKDASCRFLRPKAWHEKQDDSKNGTLGVFLTLEKIAPPEMRFDTGVSINVIQQISTRGPGISASDYITQFVSLVHAQEGGTVVKVRHPTRTIYELSGAVQTSPKHAELRKQHVLLADDELDIAVIAAFETPATEWDENWPLAEPILSMAYFHAFE